MFYSLENYGVNTVKTALRHYGNANVIFERAKDELKNSIILAENELVLTPHYLFEFKPWSVAVIPLESVLWVFDLQDYKYSFRERKERMYFSLRITTITGDNFILRDYPKKNLDKILEILTDNYPNFFYGYSEDHEKMVNYILRENQKELDRKNNKK